MSDNWFDAVAVEDLSDGDVVEVHGAGREVAVCRVGEEFYAIDNTCTHGQARLCDGFLEGYELECPLHQGKFDVRNGRALTAPLTQDTRTYLVKVLEGRVLIQLDRALGCQRRGSEADD